MAENKRYYYMRLKESFFDDADIVALESMPDGILYSNILLKLYLKSLRDEGRLMLRGTIPYNSSMIAAITRHKEETVEKALEVFQNMNLIEVLDSGAIYMLEVQSYIGKSSTEADRVREFDRKRAAEKSTGKGVEIYEKSTPEYRDKSIENRECIGADKPPTHPRFVPPDVEEVRSYCLERRNGIDPSSFVDYYQARGWKLGKGQSMKDWRAAVRTWEKRRGQQEGGKANELPDL